MKKDLKKLCLTAIAVGCTATTIMAAAVPSAMSQILQASDSINLTLLGRNETGVFDASAAEIVAHDPGTQLME